MIALPRPPWSHKGDFGRVLIIGGSLKYTGAPFLAGMAALRSGADLVTLMGHERAMNAAAAQSPDLITIPFEGELDDSQVEMVLKEANHADAILIGSGLPSSSFEAIKKIVDQVDKPMVLDAAAIHALKNDITEFSDKKILLTPHSGEFNSLTNDKLSDEPKEREQQVKYWAEKLTVAILAKGHVDFISDGTRIEANMSGNPNMTVGGTGDLLAGYAVGLLAQKFDLIEAGLKASQTIGRTGDDLAEIKGASLIASDFLHVL